MLGKPIDSNALPVHTLGQDSKTTNSVWEVPQKLVHFGPPFSINFRPPMDMKNLSFFDIFQTWKTHSFLTFLVSILTHFLTFFASILKEFQYDFETIFQQTHHQLTPNASPDSSKCIICFQQFLESISWETHEKLMDTSWTTIGKLIEHWWKTNGKPM